MKKLAVFFIVFSIIFQTPFQAYAQSSRAQEIQALNECYNDVFARFKTSYESKTGQEIIVDDELRLEFLTSIIDFKATSSYPAKLASYLIAAVIYAVFEKHIYEKMNKFKPIKDIYEEESWTSKNNFIRTKLKEWQTRLNANEAEVTRLEKATTAQERDQLLKNKAEVKRLRELHADATKRLAKGEKIVTTFETQPAANRWLLFKWSTQFIATSAVALVVLFVALDEVPEVLDVYNNLPTSLEELHEAESVSEFERLLASNNPEVSALRMELLEGCKRMQGIDLDNWVIHSKGMTVDQIISELRDISVVDDQNQLKVKKK
ncbi:MAG: hypothetical protein IT286_00940 [Proteobacteria bacterium]|nr:hypothetical protein [Pseudomonadota bacterium]